MTEDRTVVTRVVRAFATRYGAPPPLLARAPGRVNLIGEHTDYNDGFVLPMALERAAWIALRPREDGRIVARSLDLDEEAEFDAEAPQRGGEGWAEYLKGTAWALGAAGHALRGWEGVLAGDVPVGAGLSSSAALELATARAFAAASGFEWEPRGMALLCQRAENEWVGVRCGIMDQMISAVGREGHAVLIDCRLLSLTPVPLPAGTVVVVMDTATRRGLVDSAYNERREQCEAAAAFFGVPALRDVTPDRLEAARGGMDDVTWRRARHVVTENDRTIRAAEAMRSGDAAALGALMDASHASLRDDFQVSSPELDRIVEIARALPGCLGARMTGAGFGGCAVALVEAAAVGGFLEVVPPAYRTATGRTPALYASRAGAGASLAPVLDAGAATAPASS